MSVSALGQKAAALLKNDGTISKADAVELQKLVTPETVNELKFLLARDNFSPDARALLTPLLKGGQVPQASPIVGSRLGTNSHGEEVRVTREIGSPRGYDDKFQAVAAARLSKADPTAVVQSNDGKWHAVETTANFFGGGTAADNSAVRAVQGLTSNRDIAKVQGEIAALKQASPIDTQALTEKRLLLAELIFGVPRGELVINGSSTDREAGRINITGGQFAAERGAPRGRHGPEHAKDEQFDLGHQTAFEISLNELDTPAGAAGVLFHEVSHENDFELAQKWALEYQNQTGSKFVAGQAGAAPFQAWLQKQVPKKLSAADAEMVADIAAGANNSTEAKAFTGAFLTALQSGDSAVATEQLVTYAKALKRGDYAPLLNGSKVQEALTKQLEAAYREMPKEMQADFRAAVAEAKKANPEAFVSQLKFWK